MPNTLHLTRTGERPDIRLWLLDDDGSLVNMTGYSFVFKLGQPGSAATFTKSTGITGAAGSGTEDNGVPNVVMTFTAAELDGLVPGSTTWQLRCTSGGLDRPYKGACVVEDVIT
jgi:hypothetical protein